MILALEKALNRLDACLNGAEYQRREERFEKRLRENPSLELLVQKIRLCILNHESSHRYQWQEDAALEIVEQFLTTSK
jgi:hypothetical protein